MWMERSGYRYHSLVEQHPTGKGGDIERGDFMVDGPATWEFVLTDLSIQLLTEQDGLLLVGDGYTVKKVTIE